MVSHTSLVWLQFLLLVVPVVSGWAAEPPIERTVEAVPNGEFPEVDFGKVCPGDTLILNVVAPICYKITSGHSSGGGDSPWTDISATKFTAVILDSYRGLHNGTFNGTMAYTCGGGGGSGGGETPPPITWKGTAKAEVIAIKHATTCIASENPDTTRTTVGVCEEVILTTDPVTDVIWSATSGTLAPEMGSQTRWIAPEAGDTCTVSITHEGRSCGSVTFTIIAPSGLTSTKLADLQPQEPKQIGAGMRLNVIVQPRTVSFCGIELREDMAPSINISGYFANNPPDGHLEGEWSIAGEDNAEIVDEAAFALPATVTSVDEVSTYDWDIPVRYRCIDEGGGILFQNNLQQHRVDPPSTATITKLGQSSTRTPAP
jgi:hypothetical protein